MRFIKLNLIVVFIFIASTNGWGQSKADSLLQQLEKATIDSVRMTLLLDLSKSLYNTQPEKAIEYAQQAKDLAIKLDRKVVVGYALKNIGLAYYVQGNYAEVLVHWEESLNVFTAIGDKAGQANLLSNIGAVYADKGDNPHALDYYLKSLRLAEEESDTSRIATTLANIGSVYETDPNTYDKAAEYFLRALMLAEATKDTETIGWISSNLGNTYTLSNKFDEALVHLRRAEEVFRDSGDDQWLSNVLSSTGEVYALKGDYKRAEVYQMQAIELTRRYGYRLELARSLTALAQTYTFEKRTAKAIETFLEAEKVALAIDARFELKDIYEGLAAQYSKAGDFSKAFKYQQLLISVKDQIYTDDNVKKMETLQFEFDLEKKESEISLLTKDRELKEMALKRQQFGKNVSLVGLGLVLLIVFFLYRNYQIKVRANKLLAQQNSEILQQKEEIETQRNDIESQKTEIENLILNILPLEVAQELRKTGAATPRYHESVSILFTDFKEFSRIAETLPPQQLVKELNECFIAFDNIIEELGLEKIKTIGDAYMCACGIPTVMEDHAVIAVRAAIAIQKYIDERNRLSAESGVTPFEIRIGIHTGPVVAGVVGRKKFAYDIWGNAVNIAARLEANGAEGKVNVSNATYELIKSHFKCQYRGKINAKNIGDVDMYFVEEEIKA